MAAHAAGTAIHDVVADDDALHGYMLARAALGTFVVDTESAVGKKVSHAQLLDRCWTSRCGG